MSDKELLEGIEMKYDWGIESRRIDYNLDYADISYLLSLANIAVKHESTLKRISEDSTDLNSVKELAKQSLKEVAFHPSKGNIEKDILDISLLEDPFE